MMHCLRLSSAFFSLLLLTASWGAELILDHSAAENLWHCTASDGQNKQWQATGEYERTALNKAFESCKKLSKLPMTCKVANENCGAILSALDTRPLWQCTALDHNSKLWKSNLYPEQDSAALAAKALCQQESTVPDTCYVNLIGCRNLNAT